MAKIRTADMIRILAAYKAAKEFENNYEETMAVEEFNQKLGMNEHGPLFHLINELESTLHNILDPDLNEDNAEKVWEAIEETIINPIDTYNRIYQQKEENGYIALNNEGFRCLRAAQKLSLRFMHVLQRVTYTNSIPLQDGDPLKAVLTLSDIEIL